MVYDSRIHKYSRQDIFKMRLKFKQKKLKNKSGLTSILFVTMLCLMVLYSHELVHQVIYYYYGCTDIESNYFTFNNEKAPGFILIAYTDAKCDIQKETWDSMHLAHSINDIIGYTIVPILILLSCLFWDIRNNKRWYE